MQIGKENTAYVVMLVAGAIVALYAAVVAYGFEYFVGINGLYGVVLVFAHLSLKVLLAKKRILEKLNNIDSKYGEREINTLQKIMAKLFTSYLIGMAGFLFLLTQNINYALVGVVYLIVISIFLIKTIKDMQTLG